MSKIRHLKLTQTSLLCVLELKLSFVENRSVKSRDSYVLVKFNLYYRSELQLNV